MITPFPISDLAPEREGWVLRPLRALLSANDGGVWGEEPRLDGSDTLVLRSTEQTVDGKWSIDDPMPRSLSTLEKLKALLHPGDLLVTKSSGSEMHIGKTTIVDQDIAERGYCFSNFMQRLRVNEQANPKFIYWVLNSSVGRSQMAFLSNTTTGLGNLNAAILNDVRIFLPDIDEQAAIANFLDHETAASDGLLADYRCLIELLEEKRMVLITEAVTKGLDRKAPLRHSGVEWIGDIPAHWKIVPFKYCASISEGQVDPRDERYADAVLLAPNHIESSTGRWLVREKASEQSAISGKYLVRAGDVVYSKIRPALNKATVADIECLCSADMYPLRPTSRMTSSFLLYTILSKPFVSLASEISMRVAMPKINRAALGSIPMPVPSLVEQRQVSQYLAKELADLDSQLAQSRQAVELIKERRSALITAAVTGQIDISSYKSQLVLEVA